ncbi:MAG TPA: metallophosphoesterase family protein, partial [Vicinamibacterales bacterium]
MSALHRPIVGLLQVMLIAAGLSITTAGEAATITRGPYLQMGSHNRIVVRWRTDVATNSQVSYGLCHGQNCMIWVAVDATVKTEHEVMLQGLSPKTRYYYAVGSTTEQLAGNDATHFFVTSPAVGESKATRIWVLGDSGSANSNARAVRDAYYKYTGSTHTDLWLMLGDNAYDRGTDSEYQAAVFNMYPEMLRKSVLWPTLGNHDGASANSGTQSGPYYENFTLPKKAEAGGTASGTEAYYSFDYGNIHFIVLDSFDSSRSANGAMMNWLRSDLQATNQPWIIAYWHHPPYSKGSHDSDSAAASRDIRQNALPILENYGVDLVLSGHSHNYERSFLLNGHYGVSTTLTPDMILDAGDGRTSGTGAYKKASDRGAVYTVAGSSGKTGGGSLDHPAMFISLSVLGSVVLNVNGNRLDAKFIRSTGSIQDEFSIDKGPVPRDIDVSPTSHTYGSVPVGSTAVK